MYKLLVALMLALMAVVCLADPYKSHGEFDRDPAELPEGYRKGGVANILSHDVYDKGVPKLVSPAERECRNAPSRKRCETCCAQTNRSYTWSRDIQVRKIRIRGCTCNSRTPNE